VPTLKEQGINVEIGNWRGVYGAPGITPAQRKDLIDAINKAIKSKAWPRPWTRTAGRPPC
jgi:putative tricarboxylic transport membrane protein